MRRPIALGAAVVGGMIVLRSLSPAPRRRLRAAVIDRMRQRMEHLMASLPEDAPPKLVMSILPRLRDQNDQIIAMLREQNGLLRENLQTAHGSAPREP
jgi:hypothetical protein